MSNSITLLRNEMDDLFFNKQNNQGIWEIHLNLWLIIGKFNPAPLTTQNTCNIIQKIIKHNQFNTKKIQCLAQN